MSYKRYAVWERKGDEFPVLLAEYDDEVAAWERVSKAMGPDVEAYMNNDDWAIWVEDRRTE